MSAYTSCFTPQPNIQESPTIVPPQVLTQEKRSSDQQLHTEQNHVSFKLKLTALYSVLFFAPILGAMGINAASTKNASLGMLAPTSAQESPIHTTKQTYEQVIPVSADALQTSETANSAITGNDYAYELSLANGFLRKAIELSNATDAQTVEEKQLIVEYLTQGLEAANRAITIKPEDARGYSSRGRIYQATSIVKPEMKTLADADFAKAQELGATNPTDSTSTTNPIEHLPTNQAQVNNQTIIAAPEDRQQGEISGEALDNVHQGVITLVTGQTEVFVEYAQVTTQTKIFVEAEENAGNVALYIKNKTEGKGFIIAATDTPEFDIDITWKEIK